MVCFVHKIIRWCFVARSIRLHEWESARSAHSMHLHIFVHLRSHSRFRFCSLRFLFFFCIFHAYISICHLSHTLDYIIFNSLLPFSFIMMLGSTQCTFAANPKHTSNDNGEANWKCDQQSSVEQLNEWTEHSKEETTLRYKKKKKANATSKNRGEQYSKKT